MSNKVQIIKTVVKDLMDLLKIQADVMVLEDGDAFKVEILSDDSALIIGARGQNLYSLEHLVRVLTNRHFEDYARITLDIGGYRDRRRARLEEMVQKIAKEVQESGSPRELEFMSPSERRLVHTICQSVDGITSESTGEGNNRRVVIRVE